MDGSLPGGSAVAGLGETESLTQLLIVAPTRGCLSSPRELAMFPWNGVASCGRSSLQSKGHPRDGGRDDFVNHSMPWLMLACHSWRNFLRELPPRKDQMT